jgi:MtN3 and saliva related transmembrane protein
VPIGTVQSRLSRGRDNLRRLMDMTGKDNAKAAKPTIVALAASQRETGMTESIGWFAAIVLLTTIGRQVYTQWRDGSSKGLSRWLFIGQITASVAFIIYSWLLGNWVFVVTNALMLVTAILGQWVYLTNQQRAAAD